MATDPDEVEIAAVIREIQDRVRARYPLAESGSARIAFADLMPLLRARDRAEAKVAAIGSVNPRAPGFFNDLIQSFKRTIARGLNWFIRDQVDFNRASLDCIQALIEALNETNRAMQLLTAEAQQSKDVRLHWVQWRQEWERKLSINEIQFLRCVADLQTAFQHRVSLMEGNFRDLAAGYHRDFTVALDQARIDIQQRLWADLDKIRTQYEKLIHTELRVLRQRVTGLQPPVTASPEVVVPAGSGGIRLDEAPIDSLRFADRFRGTEEYVRKSQQRYLELFRGCAQVVDLGCGRGEFLEALRDSGVLVKGIDSNAELVAICRSKSLYAEQADLFDYLGELDESSLDGIFCGQVVEHLPPLRIPELISLAAAALRPGGRIVIETPNPECLAIFATHFYLDPTHQRPVPASLLAFYLEESGFGGISIDYVNPAVDTMPGLRRLPEEFRNAFFGGLDYGISAIRL